MSIMWRTVRLRKEWGEVEPRMLVGRIYCLTSRIDGRIRLLLRRLLDSSLLIDAGVV